MLALSDQAAATTRPVDGYAAGCRFVDGFTTCRWRAARTVGLVRSGNDKVAY